MRTVVLASWHTSSAAFLRGVGSPGLERSHPHDPIVKWLRTAILLRTVNQSCEILAHAPAREYPPWGMRKLPSFHPRSSACRALGVEPGPSIFHNGEHLPATPPLGQKCVPAGRFFRRFVLCSRHFGRFRERPRRRGKDLRRHCREISRSHTRRYSLIGSAGSHPPGAPCLAPIKIRL